MNLYCDNYATCNQVVIARGEAGETVQLARAKGWHLYAGFTLGGKYIDIKLCPACIGTPRSKLSAAPAHLDGQLEMDLGGSDEQGATAAPPEAGRDV